VGQPNHARRIDYILVGRRHNHPHATARVRHCAVALTDPPVSDHYGVVADIEMGGCTACPDCGTDSRVV